MAGEGVDNLLLEDGFNLLLEDGTSVLLLEEQTAGGTILPFTTNKHANRQALIGGRQL